MDQAHVRHGVREGCHHRCRTTSSTLQRVQVPNNQVLGFGLVVIVVQALGKYMIIGYLDP